MGKVPKKLITAVILSLITSTSVFAQPSSNSGNGQPQNIEMSIEQLDNQIEDVMGKINDNKKQIAKTQNDIKSAEAELDKAKKDIKNEQDLFNKRMRVLYINGFDGYVNILLDSNGISDLVTRIDNVRRIISFDNKIIADYKQKQDVISKKKDTLVAQSNKLLTLKSDNEKKLAELNKSKEDQQKLLVQARGQRLYASSDDEAAVNSALKQVGNIRNAAPRLSRGSAPLSSSNVIAYAANFMGTPYVWGGSSPNPGFDCSGFTQYVYNHFGTSIGRTTYDQINDGTPVSQGDLQPGDLVFFGSRGNPTHVGIYVGDGAYIHSPHTGDSIKISPLNRGDYLTARRIR